MFSFPGGRLFFFHGQGQIGAQASANNRKMWSERLFESLSQKKVKDFQINDPCQYCKTNTVSLQSVKQISLFKHLLCVASAHTHTRASKSNGGRIGSQPKRNKSHLRLSSRGSWVICRNAGTTNDTLKVVEEEKGRKKNAIRLFNKED